MTETLAAQSRRSADAEPADLRRVGINPDFWYPVAVSASVAVNGCCLTVVHRDDENFSAELSGETLGAKREIGLAREEVGIVLDQHAPARAARGDDVVAVLERVDRLAREPFRAFAVAGIVRWLTTAGLAWHHHLAAGVFEQFDRRKSDARPDDVDEAGDEQSDARLRFRA